MQYYSLNVSLNITTFICLPKLSLDVLGFGLFPVSSKTCSETNEKRGS